MNSRYTLALSWLTSLVFALPMTLAAEDYRYHEFSSATNGLTLNVCFRNTAEGPTVDDPIWFQFFSATNSQPFRVYLPEDKALCQFKLLDRGGHPVEKSRVGRRYGGGIKETNTAKVKLSKDQGGSYVSTIVVPNGSGKFNLPSCSELFKVERAEDYTLIIEMQVIRERVENGTFLGKELVRFPDLSVKLANDAHENTHEAAANGEHHGLDNERVGP